MLFTSIYAAASLECFCQSRQQSQQSRLMQSAAWSAGVFDAVPAYAQLDRDSDHFASVHRKIRSSMQSIETRCSLFKPP